MRKFVAVWDHFDPDVLYLLKGDAEEIIKKIGEYSDYCYREIETESKLLGVEWNDEECYSWYVPGESLDEAKSAATNDIYNQLKKIQQEQPDYGYIYLECCLYGGGEFEKEFVLETEQDIQNATKVYVDRFLKYVEDSYVDCDSSSAIAILDLENETVEIGQEVIFTTLEQFIGEDNEEEPANENDYKKFRDAVLNGLKYKPSEWRDGQYVFNHINEYYGVARAVQHIDGIDCFHNDSKIDEFIEACYKRLV